MKVKSSLSSYVILGFGALASIFCIGYFYLSVEKKDMRTVRTQTSFTTQELFVQLESKKNEELVHFIDKAIEIKGVIRDITIRDGVYSIVLDGNGEQRHILCEMQKEQYTEINTLKIGEEIVIKGILKGFLLDAILLNCIVV